MSKVKNYELLNFDKEKRSATIRILLNPEEKKYQFYLPRLITHTLVDENTKKMILTIKVEVE